MEANTAPSDAVHAGPLNGEGAVVLETTGGNAQTMLAQSVSALGNALLLRRWRGAGARAGAPM